MYDRSENDFAIAQARQEDIGALAELIGLLFAVEEDFQADSQKQTRALQMLLEKKDAYIFTVRHKDKPVAMCSVQILVSTAEGGYKALIEDVIVSPSFRGQKIGSKLFAHLEKWSKEKGIARLDLVADKENSAGLSFYDELGWHTTKLVALQKKL